MARLSSLSIPDRSEFSTVADIPAPPPDRGIDPIEILVHSDGDQLRTLAELAQTGAITARPSRTLTLDQAATAHELVQAGGLAGKVVLEVG